MSPNGRVSFKIREDLYASINNLYGTNEARICIQQDSYRSIIKSIFNEVNLSAGNWHQETAENFPWPKSYNKYFDLMQ